MFTTDNRNMFLSLLAGGLTAYHLMTNKNKDGEEVSGATAVAASLESEVTTSPAPSGVAAVPDGALGPVYPSMESALGHAIPGYGAALSGDGVEYNTFAAASTRKPMAFTDQVVPRNFNTGMGNTGSSSLRDMRLQATGDYGGSAATDRARQAALYGAVPVNIGGKRGDVGTHPSVFQPNTGMPDGTRDAYVMRGMSYDYKNGEMNDARPGDRGTMPGKKQFGHFMDRCVGQAPGHQRGYMPPTTRGLEKDGNFGKAVADASSYGSKVASAVITRRDTTTNRDVGRMYDDRMQKSLPNEARKSKAEYMKEITSSTRGKKLPDGLVPHRLNNIESSVPLRDMDSKERKARKQMLLAKVGASDFNPKQGDMVLPGRDDKPNVRLAPGVLDAPLRGAEGGSIKQLGGVSKLPDQRSLRTTARRIDATTNKYIAPTATMNSYKTARFDGTTLLQNKDRAEDKVVARGGLRTSLPASRADNTLGGRRKAPSRDAALPVGSRPGIGDFTATPFMVSTDLGDRVRRSEATTRVASSISFGNSFGQSDKAPVPVRDNGGNVEVTLPPMLSLLPERPAELESKLESMARDASTKSPVAPDVPRVEAGLDVDATGCDAPGDMSKFGVGTAISDVD